VLKKLRDIFIKESIQRERTNEKLLKDKAIRFKIKKLMEKSLIMDHLIGHLLTADPHMKTRKKNFYLLQVTVLIQNKLRKRPSSNVIRLIR